MSRNASAAKSVSASGATRRMSSPSSFVGEFEGFAIGEFGHFWISVRPAATRAGVANGCSSRELFLAERVERHDARIAGLGGRIDRLFGGRRGRADRGRSGLARRSVDDGAGK